MRALIVYPISEDFVGNSGIIRKMEQQAAGFRQLGFDTVLAYNSRLGAIINGERSHRYTRHHGQWSTVNHYAFFWDAVLKNVPGGDYSLIYIRYPGSSPMFLRFLSQLKRRYLLAKIVVEIATYPFRNEMRSAKQKLILLSDDLCSPLLRRYVSRIVTFYGQDSIYGIPCLQTGNGIDPSAHKPKHVSAAKGSVLRLLAVANMCDWHGYDRLIIGMGNDKRRHERSLELHLVGDGPAVPLLKSLVKDFALEQVVTFHGFQTAGDLDALFDLCHIGVGSLGLHRLRLEKASSLKTREYCARGIPFIHAGSDIDFPDAWSAAMRTPSTDSPIEVDAIRSFWEGLDAEQTAHEMRVYAVERLSWAAKLSGLMPLLHGQP